jgi:hypothetical protein
MKLINYLFYNTIFIVATISSCREVDDLLPPNLTQPVVQETDIIMSVVKDNVPADGVNYNEILVKIDNTLKNNFNEVIFEISPNGKFSNGAVAQKVPIDVNGEARVYAESTSVGTSIVRATVGTYTRQIGTIFEKAWPDQIIVESDSVFLPALPGMNTAVRAKLSRSTGVISPGITVLFTDSTGVNSKPSVGVFLNTTVSDASGFSTTRYWLQDTTYHGEVYLIAIVQAQDGEKRGRTRVRIR